MTTRAPAVLKILHRQFHLISTVLVIKTQKNEWKWRNLHRWQKFYTAAGTDGMGKFHLCFQQVPEMYLFSSSFVFISCKYTKWMFAKNCLLLFFAAAQKESQSCGNCPQLDSAAVSIFVVILVELTNTVFVNSTNITTNIETAVLSAQNPLEVLF